MYLLDTNVISELRKKPGRIDANVLAWSEGVHPLDQYISVVTLQELETGVLLLDRHDPAQANMLRHWLETMLRPAFAKRILPVTQEVALRNAQFHIPDPHPYRDSLIAATAFVHGLIVVTRNVTDFRRTGVRMVNPWVAQ
jgi:predicted nucleic acid-binding protein